VAAMLLLPSGRRVAMCVGEKIACSLTSNGAKTNCKRNVNTGLPQMPVSLQRAAMGWQVVPTALSEFGAEF